MIRRVIPSIKHCRLNGASHGVQMVRTECFNVVLILERHETQYPSDHGYDSEFCKVSSLLVSQIQPLLSPPCIFSPIALLFE